jgi:two-component system, OmpR family, response regulator
MNPVTEMKKRVLIIDDETDFALIMKSYLVKKGYEVSVAYTLRDGMEKVREFRPEMLFLDNNLPDGNGWEAVPEIVEFIPHIRAYLVSAHRNYSPLMKSNSNILVWEKPISFDLVNRYF